MQKSFAARFSDKTGQPDLVDLLADQLSAPTIVQSQG